jgi:hypothetical protein
MAWRRADAAGELRHVGGYAGVRHGGGGPAHRERRVRPQQQRFGSVPQRLRVASLLRRGAAAQSQF